MYISGRNSSQNFDENDEGDCTGGKWVCQIMVAEGVIGVLGNLLVCFVILRVKFLHNMTNYLLVNLAVADMLTCLTLFFYNLTVSPTCTLVRYVPNSSWQRELLCRILASSYLGWAFSYISAYSLCLVTLERYVAVVHPLQYARKLTVPRMITLISLTWVISFAATIPFLLINSPSDDPDKACSEIKYPSESFPVVVGVQGFLFAFLLPVAMMSWAYYKIQVTLKRQAKALNLRHARAAAYDLVIARQRLVSMLTLVLGALIILWMPVYISLICLHPTNTSTFLFCGSSSYVSARGILNFLFYLNSVINPFIYEFKYKKFQQGLKVAFCGCFSGKGGNRVATEMAPL
ncbi:trace amine-associated receptor 1-like [Patiria miniata]|uniref:G-protein coupled receptors family 1 profile domain-containing protein n=1 Tax=Patiria miniata TaxID=46514 RepID=A0A914AUZ6_PATMI|nr:trace amine-associated receptor 1-like [Patiria miniata]